MQIINFSTKRNLCFIKWKWL